MSKEPEEQTLDELRASIAASQAAEVAPPTAEPLAENTGTHPESTPVAPAKEAKEEFVHTASDGTVYRSDSAEGLQKKVFKALDDNKAAVKDRESQINALKTPAPTPPTAPEVPVFEQEIYIDLLNTDALRADEYKKQFDPDIQALRAERERNASGEKVRNEVLRFYKEVPAYAQIETPELNQILRARLEETNRPFTAEGLGMTYYELYMEGKMGKAPTGTPVQNRKPMPSSPASEATNSDAGGFSEDMTLAEMKKYLKKAGVPGSEYFPS